SCFFLSSRRRHTRSKRDWSSDVCSSDLRQCFYHCFCYCTSSCNWSPVVWVNKTECPGVSRSLFSRSISNCCFESCICFYSSLHRSEERRVGKECSYW